MEGRIDGRKEGLKEGRRCNCRMWTWSYRMLMSILHLRIGLKQGASGMIRKGGRKEGLKEGWIDGWMERRTEMDGLKEGMMERWKEGRIEGRMEGGLEKYGLILRLSCRECCCYTNSRTGLK
jgi:hypothetical protein